MAKRTRRVPAIRLRADGTRTERADAVAGEEPLEIALDGERWLLTMRTPGDDIDLVHGLLLAEGIVTHADQVRRVEYGGAGPGERERSFNLINVTLGAGAVAPSGPSHTGYVSSACGICGVVDRDALSRTSAYPVPDGVAGVPISTLLALPALLREHQVLFDRTGGTHAAGLFSGEEVLAVREDVGRHNAVDKVVGWAMRSGRLPLGDVVLQVSGRASFELVQKAAMAGIAIMAAVSAPSAAAVELAEQVGMTLVGFSRGDGAVVYAHPHRITG